MLNVKPRNPVRCSLQTALATSLAWLLACAPLFAQTETEEKAPKSYVMGYSLVVLCLSLGLFVVVRMGKRKQKKIKRKEEDWD